MMMRYALLTLVGFLTGVNAWAQANTIFGPIELGQTMETVAAHLVDHAGEVSRFTPGTVSFPLAEEEEAHWIVDTFATGKGPVGKMALVFADGYLVFIQVQQGVLEQLEASPDMEYDQYEDYRFYKGEGLVVHAERDMAWKLSEAGLHLNLFAWDHPMLEGKPWPEYTQDVQIPLFLEMGASLEKLEPLLDEASDFIFREKLDGSDPNAQLQLNCFGVQYAGFARKVEARFGDGQLNTVWVLTSKAEENRLREALIEAYGPPIFVSDQWEAFEDWQVYLRKDKPEVLFLTASLGHYYKKEYFGQ
jgi:hypothetical protein